MRYSHPQSGLLTWCLSIEKSEMLNPCLGRWPPTSAHHLSFRPSKWCGYQRDAFFRVFQSKVKWKRCGGWVFLNVSLPIIGLAERNTQGGSIHPIRSICNYPPTSKHGTEIPVSSMISMIFHAFPMIFHDIPIYLPFLIFDNHKARIWHGTCSYYAVQVIKRNTPLRPKTWPLAGAWQGEGKQKTAWV